MMVSINSGSRLGHSSFTMFSRKADNVTLQLRLNRYKIYVSDDIPQRQMLNDVRIDND